MLMTHRSHLIAAALAALPALADRLAPAARRADARGPGASCVTRATSAGTPIEEAKVHGVED
jgi:hypothetical protein